MIRFTPAQSAPQFSSRPPRFSGRRINSGDGGRRIVVAPQYDSKVVSSLVNGLQSTDTWIGSPKGFSVKLREPREGVVAVAYAQSKRSEALSLVNDKDQATSYTRLFGYTLAWKKSDRAELNTAFDRAKALLADFNQFPPLKSLKAIELIKAKVEAKKQAPTAEKAADAAPVVVAAEPAPKENPVKAE